MVCEETLKDIFSSEISFHRFIFQRKVHEKVAEEQTPSLTPSLTHTHLNFLQFLPWRDTEAATAALKMIGLVALSHRKSCSRSVQSSPPRSKPSCASVHMAMTCRSWREPLRVTGRSFCRISKVIDSSRRGVWVSFLARARSKSLLRKLSSP